VLLSWTGTMFEYLMPMLWMKTYPNTILDEATQSAVRAQRLFAKSKSIPWGVSESSCAKLSVDGHYHYQAFGVPALAINQEKPDDLVVSPYSSFLALRSGPGERGGKSPQPRPNGLAGKLWFSSRLPISLRRGW